MSEREHQRLLRAAIAREGKAYALLVEGDGGAARKALSEVADLYRRSWEAAPPRAYGRLIGMLKASVLAGRGGEAAEYVRRALGPEPDSAVSAYALALAALVEEDDDAALRGCRLMREGKGAFARTAAAIEAIASADLAAYEAALGAIVEDFSAREEHLTGVPVADTALVLQRLAEGRGLAARLPSSLLPRL